VSDRPSFAHETEAAFADLLDLLGIRWEYEPEEFGLEHDARDRVTFGFRPDFYLPDHELYVELTTAKEVTRKNRQLRLMAELYPEKRVVLLRRRNLSFIHEVPAVSVD
jgi:hypothetical protein